MPIAVGVLVGVPVGVLVGVSVGVPVAVADGVLVGVSVGVQVGVSVGARVGVNVELGATTMAVAEAETLSSGGSGVEAFTLSLAGPSSGWQLKAQAASSMARAKNTVP